MSVILFTKEEVFQQLADAYEGLKHVLYTDQEQEARFYKSLRRLYFANVATYLCQYHDDTPLSQKELASIDPFLDLRGKSDMFTTHLECLNSFLEAWGSLQYNLVTNDGEQYEAKEAYSYIASIAERLCREVVSNLTDKAA